MTSVIGTLEVNNDLDELKRVYAFLDSVAASHSVSEYTRRHLFMATEELFSNLVNHGYTGGQRDTVHLTLLGGPDTLTLVLEDGGAPFDASKVPNVDLSAPSASDMKVGGLGLYLIHQVCETVTHARADGRNTTRATLRLGAAPK